MIITCGPRKTLRPMSIRPAPSNQHPAFTKQPFLAPDPGRKRSIISGYAIGFRPCRMGAADGPASPGTAQADASRPPGATPQAARGPGPAIPH
jgi:hypothetical protein